jgi:uracil-DNA glycosylase family 4
LIDAYMTAAIRCAPPKNKPTPRQMERCAGHMRAEFALLRRIELVVGLGKIGFDTGLARLAELGCVLPKPRPQFGHGVEYRLARGTGIREITLIGTYHPSRQNTNTGKLTQAMLDGVFRRVRELLDAEPVAL